MKTENNNTRLWQSSNNDSDTKTLAELSHELQPIFESIIEEEKLGAEIAAQLDRLYLPFANWIAAKHTHQTIVIGINGAQGSGKSTLSKILKSILAHAFNKSVVTLSIDDLYLSRQCREALAKEVHPLFITRGVPGTHDVKRGREIISTLLNPSPGLSVKIPVFDKSIDDLLPEQDWRSVTNDVDIILFEGWCVGAQAQSHDDLESAINELEINEDPDLVWRHYINEQLRGDYQLLFDSIDYQVMLKVPDMASVFEWRHLQEEKLAARLDKKKASLEMMSEKELARFIMHFERITRFTLDEMPGRADVVLLLNKDHQVCDVALKVGE